MTRAHTDSRPLRAVLITLGDPGTLTGGYLFHRRLAELAPAHGARLEFVSFPERPFPLAILDAPRVFADAAARAPDVLVLDSIAAAFAGPWLSTHRQHAPILGMLHQPPGGIDHAAVRTHVQAVLDRLAYLHLPMLLVASDALAVDLRRQLAKPVAVVPPGRDVASAAGTPPDDPRRGRQSALLSVGNWVERKGLLSLLEAVAQLEPELATLHLVGNDRAEPGYAARVRARLAQPDLAERVVVHGPLSIGQVAAWYAAADAFVLPSLKEPFGTVYGEAMAFGLPVIGWRAGNLPYLAEHEREGLLCEPGDISCLAEALRRLANDASLRQRLGAAARARALTRPTWDQVAALFFDHLRAYA